MYLTEKEAAAHLRMHKDTLRKLRYAGNGPKHYTIGPNVRYLKRELDDWAKRLDGLLDHKQAAQVLRIHPETLRRYRREGRGPDHVRKGKKFWYTRPSLDSWLRGA